LEVPVDSVLEAFRAAKTRGVTTILNPAPAAELPAELLRLTDLCVPNESELALLDGSAPATPADLRAAGRKLRARGVAAVIVTLGADGALLLDAHDETHVAGARVQAVDTTGAGDAFIGSLAVFLARGHSRLEAIKRANAVAALSVTRPGAQASFPKVVSRQ
jgi:ribokinase